ncbi:MAG: beta-propeller fold lactonase family protein [Pseudomonadota bacterium]
MKPLRATYILAVFLSLCGFVLPAAAGGSDAGGVFTMSNAADGNAILVFAHRPHQGLVGLGSVPTGGLGSGSGLGNQGGLLLGPDRRALYAVNAGSNSISVFSVRHGRPRLIGTVAAGGQQPVSLTRHGRLLYVLNAGSDSIAGFTVDHNGMLSPLADSVRSLSGSGTGPAQVGFTPWGDALVVTEKATNRITTFVLDADGRPGPAVVNASAGTTPFGFAFDRYGHLLVSEANGGAVDASSLSSYDVRDDGTLELLAAAVPTTETAACWVVTSRNGRYAFTTNAGSSSISAFRSHPDGSLTLTSDDGVAASTGAGTAPIDMALSSGGNTLFALSAADGSIAAFRVLGNRRLVPIPGVTGLPTGLNGLAAY